MQLYPREGEETLRTEDIEAAIKEHGDGLALVMLSGVQYYTGQAFELERIAKAAHANGSVVGSGETPSDPSDSHSRPLPAHPLCPTLTQV